MTIAIGFALGGLFMCRALAAWPVVRVPSMGVSLACFIVAHYLLFSALPT